MSTEFAGNCGKLSAACVNVQAVSDEDLVRQVIAVQLPRKGKDLI
jgi:hypothetical protein